MSLLYFFIILSALVIVHEMGHFLVAKYFDIRVDEFGLGYPPRAAKLFKWKNTLFTLNWLPFGGFVKIFGENPDPQEESADPRSFSAKKRPIQAAVLVAGVVGNFLFAWILISGSFMGGLPLPLSQDLPVTDAHTVITTVVQDSPADKAGIKAGDRLEGLSRNEDYADLDPESASLFIGSSDEPITLILRRGEEILTKTVSPVEDVVEGKVALGIGMDTIGTVKLSPVQAVLQGFKTTSTLTLLTAKALGLFFFEALTGHASFSDVTGPVGLVSMVGDVRALGFIYLISFTALISINLAVVNLLPIPALDGGRLLFVAIESVIRRPVSPVVFNYANNIGFALLLILMAVITFRDIIHLI